MFSPEGWMIGPVHGLKSNLSQEIFAARQASSPGGTGQYGGENARSGPHFAIYAVALGLGLGAQCLYRKDVHQRDIPLSGNIPIA